MSEELRPGAGDHVGHASHNIVDLRTVEDDPGHDTVTVSEEQRPNGLCDAMPPPMLSQNRICPDCGWAWFLHGKWNTASSIDQPPPIPNEGVPIWRLVVADMEERDRVGRARYGTPLQTHNGRDMLMDMYAEMLDAVVYLRGHIEERKPPVANPDPTLAYTADGTVIGKVVGYNFDGAPVVEFTPEMNALNSDADPAMREAVLNTVWVHVQTVSYAEVDGADAHDVSPHYDNTGHWVCYVCRDPIKPIGLG